MNLTWALLHYAARHRVSINRAADLIEDEFGYEFFEASHVVRAIRYREAATLPTDCAGGYWAQCQRAADALA
jgi:hypothetical protein